MSANFRPRQKANNMDTIKKILFPTDFSDTAQNAFRYCLMLADRYGAEIELLHVIYPEYEALDLPVMAAQATKEKAEAARHVVKEFVELGLAQMNASGHLQGVPIVNADVEIGTPASIIADMAKRDEADLIVMGTNGEHNALEKLWGSVTTAVIEQAHCPVWVVPEHAGYGKINIAAYATDLDEADPYHIWAYGKLLAPFSPVIRCVHVNINKSMDQALDFSSLGSFFANHAPALQIQFDTLQGDSVSAALEAFTQAHEVDLLAMYAPHHSWWERLFLRSETKAMALKTKVPLLLMKH